eukprot:Nk52_evm18s293 gene=Nk52_evmTU18s293
MAIRPQSAVRRPKSAQPRRGNEEETIVQESVYADFPEDDDDHNVERDFNNILGRETLHMRRQVWSVGIDEKVEKRKDGEEEKEEEVGVLDADGVLIDEEEGNDFDDWRTRMHGLTEGQLRSFPKPTEVTWAQFLVEKRHALEGEKKKVKKKGGKRPQSAMPVQGVRVVGPREKELTFNRHARKERPSTAPAFGRKNMDQRFGITTSSPRMQIEIPECILRGQKPHYATTLGGVSVPYQTIKKAENAELEYKKIREQLKARAKVIQVEQPVAPSTEEIIETTKSSVRDAGDSVIQEIKMNYDQKIADLQSAHDCHITEIVEKFSEKEIEAEKRIKTAQEEFENYKCVVMTEIKDRMEQEYGQTLERVERERQEEKEKAIAEIVEKFTKQAQEDQERYAEELSRQLRVLETRYKKQIRSLEETNDTLGMEVDSLMNKTFEQERAILDGRKKILHLEREIGNIEARTAEKYTGKLANVVEDNRILNRQFKQKCEQMSHSLAALHSKIESLQSEKTRLIQFANSKLESETVYKDSIIEELKEHIENLTKVVRNRNMPKYLHQ